MPRRPNTDQKRQEIIDGLLVVMAQHGYENASSTMIATAAGVSPGIIHYHFKKKIDILVELIKQISSLINDRYEKLAESAKTPKERLKAFIDARLAKGEGGDPSSVAAWVFIGAEAIRQEEVREEYQKAISQQQQILEKLICEAGQRKKVDTIAKKQAALCMAAIEGAFTLSVSAKGLMPEGYAAETLYRMIEQDL